MQKETDLNPNPRASRDPPQASRAHESFRVSRPPPYHAYDPALTSPTHLPTSTATAQSRSRPPPSLAAFSTRCTHSVTECTHVCRRQATTYRSQYPTRYLQKLGNYSRPALSRLFQSSVGCASRQRPRPPETALTHATAWLREPDCTMYDVCTDCRQRAGRRIS